MDPNYASQYLLIGLLSLVAVVLAVAPLILATFIAPKKPSVSKSAAYECGLESMGDPWVQFRVHYYLYAILFVIFDVEIVFIYPWALVWKPLGLFALAEMTIFLAILGVGLAYAWKKGALEWQ
jgi:NADH:ubiquinone oxidoreductase subunit 3 (subunit A)